MKKTNKARQEPKPQGRVPRQPKGMTELTDHDLEQVQGGRKAGGDPLTVKITFQQ